MKNPLAGIYPDPRLWPPIVLELGYTETSDELISGTDLLLEGSRGRIGFVIVIKIEHLDTDNYQVQEGYVELHKYDLNTKKRARVGIQEVTCPYLYYPSGLIANMFPATVSTSFESLNPMHRV